ncbi:MAG: hypothetical protein EU540_01340 [Promethearchaeota archaeon]|nr:MAG: hypothetical protein EU540_01340 [Candidatus Lokiarchaeota archaeon]
MRHKKAFIIILMVIISSIVLNIEINNDTNTNNKKDNIQDIENETPQESDPFIPDPPPRSGTYWDFTNDTIIAYQMISSYYSTEYIFNISSMRYFYSYENATGTSMPWDVYGVALEQMYWDPGSESLKVIPGACVINASLINYTTFIASQKMLFYNMGGFDGIGPLLNLFIPKNSSNVLDIHWCADALHWIYSYYLTGTAPEQPSDYVDKVVTPKSIHYSDPSGTYCDLYYSDNGTLLTGEMYANMGGQLALINFTRFYDFNPLNDTAWNVDVGDVFYTGVSYNEFKFNISKIENVTVEFGGGGLIPLQFVWANMSMWNVSTETWDYVDMDGGVNWMVIGSANDNYPFMYPGEGVNFIPLLLPKGFATSDFASVMELRGDDSGPSFSVTYGDDWVMISNSSGYEKYILNMSGFVELIIETGYGNLFGYIEALLYRKNSTVIDASKIWELEFDLIDIDSNEFNISMDIKVNETTHLLTSAMNINPLVNHSLSSGVLFFDIWINETDNLDAPNVDAPINITIDYDKSKYKNMKLYWFNASSMNPDEWDWHPIPFTDYGNGTIVFSVNHTSIFAFTNVVSKARGLIGGDDDDDDDDEPPIIPTGNYYLIFIAIAVIGLVIYKKRELFKK